MINTGKFKGFSFFGISLKYVILSSVLLSETSILHE